MASYYTSGYTPPQGVTSADQVKAIQQQLTQAGYNVGNTGADGIWGKNTQAAYDAYLSSNGKVTATRPNSTPDWSSPVAGGTAGSYYSGGNLALLLVDWSQGDPQPWGDLSVNLGKSIAKDCAFIDVNNLSNDILSWIEKNGLGSPTGRNEQSGFVVYPEYRFHPERLKELDDKGYAEYENLLKQQQQHMKKGWDR